MDNPNQMNTENKEIIGLKTIVVGYSRHWKLFLGAFVFSLILGVLYLILIPKTYEIKARICLQEDKGLSGTGFDLGGNAGLMRSFGFGGGGLRGVSIDDEKTVLMSNMLLSRVVKNMRLQIDYMKPGTLFYKLYKNSPLTLSFDSITGDHIVDRIRFEVSYKKDNIRVGVESEADEKESEFNYTSLPAEIKLDQGIFILDYTDGFNSENAQDMNIIVNPVSWVAEELAEDILIEEVSKSSNIIELAIDDYEQVRGVNLLNTLIELYNSQAEEKKEKDARKSLDYLDNRIQTAINDLHISELAIEEYKIQNKLTEIKFDAQFYVGQMQSLRAKIIELETQYSVIEMLDKYVKDPVNKYNLVPALLTSMDGEKGAGTINLYNEKLLERDRLLKTSTEASPLISNVNEQVNKLRLSVVQTIFNASTSLQSTIDELKDKENKLYNKMGEIPTVEREYIDYKRQQSILQNVYLVLIQKREEQALLLGNMTKKAFMVDPAFIKEKPVAPRKLYALIGIFLLTLLLPVIFLSFKSIFYALKDEYQNGVK